MKKLLISIMGLVIIFTLLFQYFPIASFATNFDTGYYDPNNNHAQNGSVNVGNTAATIVGTVLTVVQWAGAAVAIIMLVTLGAKYLYGGVDEKSTIKKSTVGYAIGAGIFFGGTVLVSVIKNFILESMRK